MKSLRAVLLSLPALLLAACVTINIYFPAAAAEKAADRIIEDVWGTQPGKEAPEAPEGSSPPPRNDGALLPQGLGRLLELLIPAAQAQQADINIATPAIDRLRASMRARHASLAPYYASGAIGLTRDGLIALRDPNAVPLKERNTVKQLVADESNDRNALYREIALANGHPEWEGEIRKTFARRWVENAAPGWWYQDEGGGWKQK